MKIKWYGHACFRLEGSGLSFITDPYTPEDANLDPVPETCDVVLMSSDQDEAHSYPQMIPGSPRVINTVEYVGRGVDVNGIHIGVIPAREHLILKEDPDYNAMYYLTLDGVRVMHMGDVGNPLTPEQIAPVKGQIDVLLALTGGGLTIALEDLDRAIEEIDPRIIIPMHYKVGKVRYQMLPVEAFLERRKQDEILRIDGPEVEITRESLPARRQILVLKPLCA